MAKKAATKERFASPAEALFETCVRVEHMIYVPSLTVDEESYCDTFCEEFVEGLPERKDAPIYRQLPKLKRFAEADEGPEPWMVADVLRGLPGFIVQAAAPCRSYLKDGSNGWTWSWGNYWTEWLYAPTEADIATRCVEWAEWRAEQDRAASLKAEKSSPPLHGEG